MQNYQFRRTSHSQNTFFIQIEATENIFLLQKKVIVHAEHKTVKNVVLHLLVILKIVTIFLKTSVSTKVSIIFKSLLHTIDHDITCSSIKSWCQHVW